MYIKIWYVNPVNIDGNGNRVAALCYGPINVQRFKGIKTPCYLSGSCANCKSSESACSQVVITRTNRTVSRIKVILVGEELGF